MRDFCEDSSKDIRQDHSTKLAEIRIASEKVCMASWLPVAQDYRVPVLAMTVKEWLLASPLSNVLNSVVCIDLKKLISYLKIM